MIEITLPRQHPMLLNPALLLIQFGYIKLSLPDRIAEMADTQCQSMKERLTDQDKPAKSRLALTEAKGV
jgi:hypothetical protein